MGALSGLKVLDLSFYAPGRWPTMVLADLGADVVCVEQPRNLRPAAHATLDDDTTARWMLYQRNKRSVTLNLKTDAGQQVFTRLAQQSDIIIESYKPGTAERLHVDYDSVKKLNPAVIYCSVSGFGQTGPYSQTIGHEPNYLGLSGALGYNRKTDDDDPMMPNMILGDFAGGGTNALIGILSALHYRHLTGEGQYIDIAIVQGLFPFMGIVPYAQWNGDKYREVQNSSGRRPGFRAYRTKDDKFVAISPSEPWLWARFCTAVGHEELIADHNVMGERRDVVVSIFEKLFASRTQAEWIELNNRENLSITPVWTTVDELEADPQMQHREAIVEIDYAPVGRIKQIATPIKMSVTPPEVRMMPRYGQHTDEVYAELGFSVEERAEFRATGVCE